MVTDKARFVASAGTLARGLLREAIGYRIEQEIPFLKDTVGFMVEAPLLWIRHSRFPILFVAYDRFNRDMLATVIKQLEIARATEFFAVIIVVVPTSGATGHEADDLRHAIADSEYRHDFVVLDHLHVASIIAHNSSRRLIEIVLEQGIELSALSPYVVHGPVPANMFFGREREIKTISQSISRGDYAIVGGRRIGKSSTLVRLKSLFDNGPRYAAIYLDCEACYTEADFFAALRGHMEVGNDPVAFQGAVKLMRDKCGPKQLVFLLDEVDELLAFDARRERGGRLFRAFRAASHEGACRFVFSGSRTLQQHLRDPHSPFFNFCDSITLKCLAQKSVVEIVRNPMHQLGIELADEDSLLRRIIELTSCHPNIAQWVCDRLVKSTVARRVTVHDVHELAQTPEFNDHYISTAWGDATALEKLISLVSEEPSFTEVDVRRHLTTHGLDPDALAIGASLDVLELYSLIEREGSGYRFALTEFPRIVRARGGTSAQAGGLASQL